MFPRKTISSLASIEKIAVDVNIQNEASKYLSDIISQYCNFLENKSIEKIIFQFNEDDIVDFSYRCIESKDNDFVRLAEDVQFGIIELIKEIEIL